MLKIINHYYRVLATGLCFSLFGVGALVLVTLIFPPITLFTPAAKIRSLFVRTTIKISFKAFVCLMSVTRLISVETKNLTLAKGIRGKIIVANHPSLIDVVILISILPRSNCIVKRSLGKNFFLKHVVKSAYILASDDMESLFADCKKSLREGHNLIIFPEGTRTVPGKKSKLSRGAAQIALKTKADIIPIHISCVPPGLLKHQKWYHVADRALAFTLEAKPILNISQYSRSKTDNIAAREVTELVGKILRINN